jgi:hypothetical protein
VRYRLVGADIPSYLSFYFFLSCRLFLFEYMCLFSCRAALTVVALLYIYCPRMIASLSQRDSVRASHLESNVPFHCATPLDKYCANSRANNLDPASLEVCGPDGALNIPGVLAVYLNVRRRHRPHERSAATLVQTVRNLATDLVSNSSRSSHRDHSSATS